ncbi:LysR family transcriptional regulator [Paucibacter sp. APW11]|uniref:LysR family transcriptional regulator n=1 Tax=Roseateles aquae TaxID=3077235 RepID=A0ABU3P7T3_9BURK|nr:LysR family transcriptional regulator [Paucibacter sp. APW11]MDT8998620.1 LysR family transcriptional regulator [Paucibacter sp. APW11]
MDPRQLNHLIALAETGRFVQAAERVHLSQAAFSRSIQKLEARLGLRLFDRGPKGARLTAAGRVVVERARQLAFEQRCFARDLALLREGALGELSFGAGPVPGATLVPALLAALQRQHPALVTRVRSGHADSLLALLHAEQIDFFIADPRMLAPDARLQTQALGEVHGGLYCRSGHPLARRRSLDISVVVGHGIGVVAASAPLRAMLRASLGLAATEPLPLRVECDDLTTLARLARDSDALVLLPHALAAEQRGLRRLQISGAPPAMAVQMHAIWLRGRSLSPAAEGAMALARELAQALPREPA